MAGVENERREPEQCQKWCPIWLQSSCTFTGIDWILRKLTHLMIIQNDSVTLFFRQRIEQTGFHPKAMFWWILTFFVFRYWILVIPGTLDAYLSQVVLLYPCAFSMQALRREKRKVPCMIVNLMPAVPGSRSVLIPPLAKGLHGPATFQSNQ